MTFEWQQVGEVVLGSSGRPTFPALPDPDVVGLHRIELIEDGQRRVYIGETGRGVARRWRDYERGAGESTDNRMHARLLRSLEEAVEAVTVSHLVEVTVTVDGATVDPRDIPEPFLRKLLENAALTQAHARGSAIINGPGYSPSAS